MFQKHSLLTFCPHLWQASTEVVRSGSGGHRMKDRAKMLMLLLVWGLWYLTALEEGGTASAAFLFPSVERQLQDTKKSVDDKNENSVDQNIMKIMEDSLEILGKETMDIPVETSKLILDYRNEKKRQKVENATLYSQKEVMKLTDNHTDILFSEEIMTSIEQMDTQGEEKKEKMPEASQQEKSIEEDRPITENRFLNLGVPQPRLRLFFIYRFPPQLKSEQQVPEANWLKEEPVSDRRHRLLAIRNGLLAAPRPIKKKALLVTPTQPTTPRKRRFFFFWRKI
ncbi:dickkopf-like protein 1 isoform X1 [Anolis carolinensis]|uniref:dickkopf-like protein 1 isoform X1 n=2 Tax=Anolis carolinensis TaxID=28377 RepID=UPI002F2B6FD0